MTSKKQKVSWASLEPTNKGLNDLTACGVDLRKEEEQLFLDPKEDIRVSNVSPTQRIFHAEEESLFLEKVPLREKMFKIVNEHGLSGMSIDAERCLSLCVEERMRGLISSIVRMSKQRVDIEKTRHLQNIVITTNLGEQIMSMNEKTKKEQCKRTQAEVAEKLQKQNDVIPTWKKMRTDAANVAVQAAVGGDNIDMLSKWKLMAEEAKHKRKDVSHKSSSSTIGMEKNTTFGRRNQSPATSQTRNISFKDVIAALEREPQMCKSTFLYRLYDRIHSE